MLKDKTDEKILEFLKNDSRESFVEIGKKLSGATIIPLSPCIGSKITNAVSSSITERSDSISP